ncbi:FAD-dependent oxidoreductase [Haloechinothrix sp. YIM 98757]|uniref:FAD-dependent oxidoreductase n=1 Tax=Haloechinothrix aidingensis TaxID=2752311 RepID=A0A838A0A8_9PSEU|nr:FAD-dependent oxidoreductase [Haloechinothrix aidingensis]MBA0124513.1 FAD-dependent oxidoreductase [Haloechinothrix aidingensis]
MTEASAGSAPHSRRRFLRTATTVGAATAAALSAGPGQGWAASGRQGRDVAVLGAGVAGLTAAHELVERGYSVTVYERKALGGKARSIPVPDSPAGGRALPGEHGFRFFPGFYHDLGDTMRRVPFPGNSHGCWQNLTRATSYLGARAGRANLTVPFPEPFPPRPFPYTPESFAETVRSVAETSFRLPPHEAAFFAQKAVVYVTSSDERRLGQWDALPWSDFVRAERMSDEYRAFLADGMIRNLAAMKADEASTHSIGLVGEATAWSAMGRGNEEGGSVDRVLDGATSERWLDPWVEHLRDLGVRFEVGWAVEELLVDDGAVGAATLRHTSGRTEQVRADWFVSAIPVERFTALLTPEVLDAAPELDPVRELGTDWMNGLMFYLTEEVPITPGHVNYVDSGWAVTSISQAQFWKRDFATYGDGTVKDCLSAILSDWTSPGMFNGKAARDCRPDEIARETWAEVKAHLNGSGTEVLTDDMLHSWFLDPAVIDPGTPEVRNDEPLFTQLPGSWADRPGSGTGLRNLFLAGDWVRNDMNVTTMEGANKGGRQAVNALLDTAGSGEPRCQVTPLFRPPEFEPFKRVDRQLYRAGLPNQFDVMDPRAP